MGRPDFDKPNDKSIGQSKEYWEDQLECNLEFLKTEGLTPEEKESTEREIAICRENLESL